MSRDWTLYLEDIRDAAVLIAEFTKALSVEEFAANPLVLHATVRNLEIIGEATKRLPEEARTRMPEVDWTGSARFRDVVAHHYFGLDPAVVWNIVQTKIPVMCSAAKRVLLETDDGTSGDSEVR